VKNVRRPRAAARRALYLTHAAAVAACVQLALDRSVGASKFVSEDDSLMLEDEGARVKLLGDDLPVGSLCSGELAALPRLIRAACARAHARAGVCLAVRGRSDGLEFRVEALCFTPPRPQTGPGSR
jgi:hypothetical protein